MAPRTGSTRGAGDRQRLIALGVLLVSLANPHRALAQTPRTFDLPADAAAAYTRCSEENLAPDEAVARCREALRFELPSPVAARVHTIIGWAHWVAKRGAEAVTAWTEAARLELKDEALALGLALMLYDTGRRDEARARFKDAIRLGVEAVAIEEHFKLLWAWRGQTSWEPLGFAAEQLAVTHEELGNKKDADEAYRVAIHYYERAGERERILVCWRQLLRIEPSADGYRDLAEWVREALRDDQGAALDAYREAIRLAPRRADLHVGLAKILEAEDQLEAALREYRAALALDPKLAEARSGVDTLESLGVGQKVEGPAARIDSANALEKARACVEIGDASACRDALALGVSPARRAKVLVFLARTTSDEGAADERDPVDLLREATSLAPDYPLAHFELGRRLGYSKPEEAITALQTALRLRPDWVAAREELAHVLSQARRPTEAVPILREAARQLPDDAWIQRDLGDAFGYARMWQEQVEVLRRAARLDPTPLRTWQQLAYALRELRKPDEAIAAYREALRRATGTTEDWWNVAANLGSLKDWEGAAEGYQKALEATPQFDETRVVDALLAGGLDVYRYRDLRRGLAEALRNSGRPDEAAKIGEDTIRVLIRLTEAAPKMPSTWVWLGQAYADLDRFTDAMPAFDKAIALDGTYVGARLGLAQALIGLGRTDAAVKALHEAGEVRPQDTVMAGTLVVAFERLGRPVDAIRWWAKTVEPNAGLAYGGYYTLYRNLPPPDLGSLASAYADLASERPEDPVPEVALGFTLERLKRTDEALEAYRRTVQRRPDAAWTHARLGCFFADHKRPAEALEAFAAADRVDPNYVAKSFSAKQCRDRAVQAAKAVPREK